MDILKRQLRKQVEDRQAGLTEDYKRSADKAIVEYLFSLPEYKQAKTVFCFISMDTEINTYPILEDCFQRNVRLCVPRCLGRGVMEVRQIHDLSSLKRSKFGILEPGEEHPQVPLREIDFTVVPCVSCNTKGARLGHGGGYYDRFLLHNNVSGAVICREALVIENIPMADHDIYIPTMITENGIVTC